MRRFLVAAMLVSFLVTADSEAAAVAEQPALRRAERQNHPLKFFGYTDGGEITYFGRTVQGLTQRIGGFQKTLIDAQMVSLSYGFGVFLFATKTGEVFKKTPKFFPNDLLHPLLEAGKDPMQFELDLYHGMNKRFFADFRINDTHDNGHEFHSERFRSWNGDIKLKHPEYLHAPKRVFVPHGAWSNVDYALPVIRNEFVRHVKDVCDRYDVDGIRIDMTSHLPIFKNVAWGKYATPDEVAMFTDMMRRIRQNADAAAARRGRPILIALLTYDSPDFMLAQGVDLNRLMGDDLIDIWMTGRYFNMISYEDSVALGKKYGVPVYPLLFDPRVSDIVGNIYPTGKGWPPSGINIFRHAVETYRGRAMRLYQAGAPGIGLYNTGGENGYQILYELGDYNRIKFLDKFYFNTVDGAGLGGGHPPERVIKNSMNFIKTLPAITPNHPATLQPGRPLVFPIRTAEKIADAQAAGYAPAVELYLRVGHYDAKDVTLEFNGVAVAVRDFGVDRPFVRAFTHHGPASAKAHVLPGKWLCAAIAAESLRDVNEIRVTLAAAYQPADTWDYTYRADSGQLPAAPWSITAATGVTCNVADGVLTLANTAGKLPNMFMSLYSVPMTFVPQAPAVLEAELRVESGKAVLTVVNGQYSEFLTVSPQGAGTAFSGRSIPLDGSQWHTYRLEMTGDRVSAWVDKHPFARDVKVTSAHSNNRASFGTNYGAASRSCFRQVKVANRAALLYDAMLTVSYPEKKTGAGTGTAE